MEHHEILCRLRREAAQTAGRAPVDPSPELPGDFDHTELADLVSQYGQSRAKRSRSRRAHLANSPVPTVSVPKGINFARFYRDSEGEYLRMLDVHKFRNYLVPCHDALDCEICSRLKTVPSDWRQKWDYRRRVLSLSYAWMQSPRSRLDYVKLRQPVLLWGNEKFAEELREIIAQMGSPAQFNRFFNPLENHRFVRIEFEPETFQLSMSWASRVQRSIPPLPGDFPPLSQCICPENQPPDPLQLARFLKAMDRDCQTRREPPTRKFLIRDGRAYRR